MAQQGTAKQLPIGYWLKHVDAVITEHVDRVLDDNGFTRLRWQALNSIYEGGTVGRRSLAATLGIFADSGELNEIVNGFVQEGWVVEHDSGDAGELTLTGAGKSKREIIFQLQTNVRKQAMQGITEQEYITVIDVLQRIAQNLE